MMRDLHYNWFRAFFSLSLILGFSLNLAAQEENNQVLRGRILDNSTQNPITGALVEMLNVSPRKADYSTEDGSFRLEDIPIGRQRILIKAQGYQEILLSELNITAGKEAVIIIKLDEEVQEEQSSISGSDKKPKVLLRNSKMRPINPMALVSTRSFTIDEVRRYAGGLNDPARLVASFASTFNTDDSQNHIVSRGNAPFGIRYFIEGVPIDNPNHFHTLGNTGSALAMINPYVIDNSDFLTSAFPAEYGTAFAGIFDIHLREGNNQKHEFSAQVGLLGLEASAEGPIQKRKSSYLFNYRYSLFSFVQLLQIDVGTSALPQYQDGTFKLSFTSQKFGDISVFGMGGYGTVAFFNDEIDPNDIFAEQNRDLYLNAGSLIAGVNHRKSLSKRTYLNTTFSNVYLTYRSYRDSIALDGSKHPYYEVIEDQIIPGIATYINSKINRKVLIRTGLRGYLYMFNIDNGFLDRDQREYIFDGNIWDGQAFFEAMVKFNRAWTMNAGVFGQYMSLNANTYTVEPRFSLAFEPSIQHRFTFGYGWHSKHVPFITSFLVELQPDGSYDMGNRELGFIRSHQTELAYHWQIAKEWRLKTELFGQYLTDIPVEATPSSYSLINYGVFSLFPKVINLVSEGEAYNYGMDLTLEKFFSQGYYGHVAGTYFHSRYLASDGIWRSTGNDVRYIVQFVGGKEFKIGKRKLNTFNIDFRLHHRGGRPYTPIDLAASQASGEEVRDEFNAYSARARSYTRLDLKIGGRFNGRRNRISHYFYIDMINFSDLVAGLAGSDYFQNDLLFTYDPINERIARSTQFGLFPTFAYQIQF
jgi:hypothetical protein